jgi:hypothetical protein
MLYTLRFFFSSKCSLFHNANLLVAVLFTSYIQGVLKLKNNSGAKGLMYLTTRLLYPEQDEG